MTSSDSDLDYASNNYIYRNQFRRRAYQDMIRIGNSTSDKNNEIIQNITVNDFKSRNGFDLLPFECRVSGNNSGCEKNVNCPSGKHAVAARGACNLEYGIISDSQLEMTPWGYLKVIQSSDDARSAQCIVGQALTGTGEIKIDALHETRTVRLGCKGHNKNRGDCHIKGELLCL